MSISFEDGIEAPETLKIRSVAIPQWHDVRHGGDPARLYLILNRPLDDGEREAAVKLTDPTEDGPLEEVEAQALIVADFWTYRGDIADWQRLVDQIAADGEAARRPSEDYLALARRHEQLAEELRQVQKSDLPQRSDKH